MSRSRWRPPFAAMAALGVAMVWFGADVVGAVRPLTGPFVVVAALASAGRAEPARRRVAASISGLALGALLLWRFVERCRSVQWGARPSDTSFRLWTEIDRWVLAYDAVGLRPEHAWTIVALGVVAGLVRPRFAVAAGVLALPLTILARQRYQFGRGDLPLQVASSLGAMLGLFGLALVVGRLRRWWTPGASVAPPAAHR